MSGKKKGLLGLAGALLAVVALLLWSRPSDSVSVSAPPTVEVAPTPVAMPSPPTQGIHLKTQPATLHRVPHLAAQGCTDPAQAPQPQRPTGGEIMAYRTALLLPKAKGEAAGELREWLIRPKEGYVSHLEEMWRPDASGTLVFEHAREYVANQVLLTLDGEVDVEGLTAALEAEGYTVKDPLIELEKGGKILAVLSPTIAFETVAEMMDKVKAFDAKIVVEEDLAVYASRIPNDARYRALWAMEKIRAPEAWEVETDAPEVVVAVLDTGVNYHHEDLTENILRDKEAFDFPYINGYRSIGGRQSYDPMDDNGHGTHCAGTIAASGNNGTGVVGMTWRTKIMPLKFLNYEGKGYISDEIICMTYARQQLVDVISCSFGGGGKSAAEEQAIRQLGIMGITVICAAGNDASDNDERPSYPASHDLENIVAVASTGQSDALSEFSNYGAEMVDLGAPGEGILSTCISAIAPDKAYATLDGTSMATPHVAGAITLLKSIYPTDEPIQSIQRLLLNGADCEALAGLTTTGKRLDLYGAVLSLYPPAPIIKATAGVYEDRVEVSWKPVEKATYYRLYRMWSEGGEKALLMDWSTVCAFTDTTAEKDMGYHYYVECSEHTDGTYVSPLSKAGVGYKLQPVLDEWDTADDTPAGATVLIPTSTLAAQGEHSLSPKDTADWYQIEMTKGQSYCFTSVGASDVFAELFNAPSADPSNRVTYDDDSAGEYQFSLTYTAPSDGVYYLRVTSRNVEDSFYTLQYQMVGWKDAWDPTDDTVTGATKVTLVDGETLTHGLHELSASDTVDWFAFDLVAGKTYTFQTTGASDTYGELYYASGAAGNLVAFNDDGHDAAEGKLNFRIYYTPDVSGTYYLKVRTCFEDTPAAYHLLASVVATEVDFVFTPAVITEYLGWTLNPFIATQDAVTTPVVDVAVGTPLCVKWAFNEDAYREVAVPVTNMIELFGSSGERLAWGEALYNGTLATGTFVDFETVLPELPPGAYTVKMTLNTTVAGEASVEEVDRSNNTQTLAFTIYDPATTVVGLEITGNAEVPSKGSARYRVMATFADGTTGEVNPTWSLGEGDAWATLSAEGLLEVGALTQTQTVTLTATYKACIATKVVTLTAEAAVPESPFGEVVRYPSMPAKVSALVMIDGVPATEGDLLAAFSGDELRGIAKIAADGTVTLSISVAHSAEAITFKVFDASEGDEGMVLACAETLVLSPNDTRKDVLLTASIEDPFGQPEVGEGELCTITLQAEMKSNHIRSGDIVAAYIDSRLVAKQRLRFVGDLKNGKGENGNKGIYLCTLTFPVEETSEVTFLLWRRTNKKYHSSTEILMVEPGETYGTEENPKVITFNTGHKRSFWFPKKGWQLISFGVNPEVPAYPSVFTETDKIDAVKQEDDLWEVGSETDEEVSGREGYWVHTSEDEVAWEIEGEPETQLSVDLKAGWNLIGYPLERSGRIERVLRTALEEKLVLQVADGESVYPEGNLTMMHPGRGYWIYATTSGTLTFESTGMILMATTTSTTYGPFGDGSEIVHAPVTPTRYTQVKVNLGETSAAYGDVLAIYDTADQLFALAMVEGEDGRVSFPLYLDATMLGERSKVTLTAVLWNAESGLDNPQLFELEEAMTVTRETLGAEITGLTLNFPTTTFSGGGSEGEAPAPQPVTSVVTFDLVGKADRTGGGALTQTIAFGGAAVAPTFTPHEGWAFDHWNAPFTDVRSNLTVKAVFVPVATGGESSAKPTYTITYEANGGEGETKTATAEVGASVSLEANTTFEKEGYVFLGWSTTPTGEVLLPADGSLLPSLSETEDEEVTLYAQWAYDGFLVSAETYVCNPLQEVTVPVVFDSAEAVACLSVKLAYNTDLLEVRKVTAGSLATKFVDDFTVSEPRHGLLTISLFATEDVIPGKGTLANVTFVTRKGAGKHFSDITISDLQLTDKTGVKDVTAEKGIVTHHGMIRIVDVEDAVAQFEDAQIIVADTQMASLTLAEGDRLQASDAQTPIIVIGEVTPYEMATPIVVMAPVHAWADGDYQLLQTPTAGLNLTLADCPYPWTIERVEADGIVTYVATVVKDETLEIVSEDDSLTAGVKQQLVDLLEGQLPAHVKKLSVTGPKEMVALIVEMGIAPTLTIDGTEAIATYREPTIEITDFVPTTGTVKIKVHPGEGNTIVSEIATGYLHVYGSDAITEKMRYISKVGFDLTPYLEDETKGEAILSITLGTHTFLKVKVEAEAKVEGEEE